MTGLKVNKNNQTGQFLFSPASVHSVYCFKIIVFLDDFDYIKDF